MAIDMKSKPKAFGLVINAKKESINPIEELTLIQGKVLKVFKCFTATIIHDADILESGELKRPHLHVVQANEEKTTLKAVLSDFSSKLDILSEQISIEGSNSDYLLIQYLTHKNDCDKAQYSLDKVLTNDKDKLLSLWQETYKSQDQLRLEILQTSRTTDFIGLCESYGYNTISAMRPMIREVKAEEQSKLKDIVKANKELLEIVNDFDTLVGDLLVSLQISLPEELRKTINLNYYEKRYQLLMKIYDKSIDN